MVAVILITHLCLKRFGAFGWFCLVIGYVDGLNCCYCYGPNIISGGR